MEPAVIDMPGLADILEQATIISRCDLGAVMALVGVHPDRGAFAVIQSPIGAWITAQFDAFLPDAEIDSGTVAEALQVIRDAGRRAGALALQSR